MPTVSVILPTYNGSAYLGEQIRSIQNQSFTDWHMLICDDGSTDDTVAVTRVLAQGDPRITILPSSGNLGQRRRLKQLADATETDLIAVADQDDIWASDKLALLLDGLGDADLCFGTSWLIDGEGREFGRDIASSLPPPYQPGERLTVITRPLVSAHAMIARRKLFGAAIFARNEPFDWLMSLEAAWGGGLVFIPAAQTRHRLHGGNQSNMFFADEPKRPRLISRSSLLMMAKTVRREQFRIMAMLEHLSFADSVAADRRQCARSAWEACHNAWYPPWGQERDSRTLSAKLEALLRPLAGSDADWNFFKLHIDMVFLPLYSPKRMIARKRRLELIWSS
jgi:hypothetical protein